ncbi:MAG TPA: lamin tail domain-containing protein [Polyangiaceae bacterium]
MQIPEDAGVPYSIEPQSPLDAAPAVLRLKVQMPELDGGPAPELFAGTLSRVDVARVERDDLTKALTARSIVCQKWRDEKSGAWVLAPEHPLGAGESFSITGRGHGLIGQFSVAVKPERNLLSRLWPPADLGRGAQHVVFCAEAPLMLPAADVELAPLGVGAAVRPGADLDGFIAADRCVHMTPQGHLPESSVVVPPPAVGRVALDPAPLLTLSGPATSHIECGADELPIGPGCARVGDDRVVIRSASQPLLWLIRADRSTVVQPLQPGGFVVAGSLEPDTQYELRAATVDLAATLEPWALSLRMLPIQERVVLNEVLANPAGPEPAQEWVELVNDGLKPVSLGGWLLEDTGGSAALPDFELLPQSFVLIVGQDYAADGVYDLPPADGVAILRVPKLAKNGLSNLGEPLALREPSGTVVSRFPALAAPKSGVSAARRYPWSQDDDPSAFALHAAPGASPGAPNAVEEH